MRNRRGPIAAWYFAAFAPYDLWPPLLVSIGASF